MPHGFWGWFYMIAVILTLAHALFPNCSQPLRRGALVIGASWLASLAGREAFNTATPLEMYAAIDVLTGLALATIALQYKAIWAALCVIFHALMGFLHLAQFISGPETTYSYLVMLNGLFLSSLIVLNIAILAHRHERVGRYIEFPFSLVGGWRFVGSRESVSSGDKGKGF